MYPREVEEFLHQHPAIANVQVVGVPDLKYGEQLAAWVQLRWAPLVSSPLGADFAFFSAV